MANPEDGDQDEVDLTAELGPPEEDPPFQARFDPSPELPIVLGVNQLRHACRMSGASAREAAQALERFTNLLKGRTT